MDNQVLSKIILYLQTILNNTTPKKEDGYNQTDKVLSIPLNETSTATITITDKTSLKKEATITTPNPTITIGDKYTYKVKMYDKDTQKPLTDKQVSIYINSKEYKRSSENGSYNLDINLKTAGSYQVKVVFNGDDEYKSCTGYATITMKEKSKPQVTSSTKKTNTTTKKTTTTTTIKPNSKGEYWNPRYLTGAEGKQGTNYYCAPFSVMECIYELYGVDLSQRYLASIMDTTTNGTSHNGINQGLKKLNKKYGWKMSWSWHNLSDYTWKQIGEMVKDKNTALLFHVMWHNLHNWYDTGGHYCTLACVNPSKKYVYEIYSLSGDQLIRRSLDYMKTVTGEISQPSLLVIKK